MPIFAWNVSLVFLIFLKSSLVFPILLFSSIVFQVYVPITNAKEPEVECFYEDLQDIL